MLRPCNMPSRLQRLLFALVESRVGEPTNRGASDSSTKIQQIDLRDYRSRARERPKVFRRTFDGMSD